LCVTVKIDLNYLNNNNDIYKYFLGLRIFWGAINFRDWDLDSIPLTIGNVLRKNILKRPLSFVVHLFTKEVAVYGIVQFMLKQ